MMLSRGSFARSQKSLLGCIGAVLVAMVLASCGTPRYEKIDFAWTSDDHLEPRDRFLTVATSVQATRDRLLLWLAEQNAQIANSDDSFDSVFRIRHDAEQNFRAAQAIIKAEWDAYDRNKVRDWPQGQFGQLQFLSGNTVARAKGPATGYRVTVRMNERTATTSYLELDGSKRMDVYNPGFTAYDGLKKVTIPGQVLSLPTFQPRSSSHLFYSVVNFYIFEEQGQTRVYARGLPVDKESSVSAGYGNSIGYAFWRSVTGREEAESIRSAFAFLKQSDAK